MAAYAALVSLYQLIEQIMPHQEQYFLLCRKQHMNSLHQNVILLQKFLEEFAMGRSSRSSHLESRIREGACQVEDIIESHISAEILRKQEFSSWSEKQSAFRRCTEEIESIVGEAMMIKNNCTSEDFPTIHGSSTTSRDAPRSKETAVGLDNDLDQIKLRVAPGQVSKLQIIPIIGMGGIGKTTLARHVYEDPMTAHYFDIHCWATVSQTYNIRDILVAVLRNNADYVAMEDSGEGAVELLIERVYKMLKGRRYLIVLDDMWHGEAWTKVRRAFPDDDNSSRVILTTRLSEVAAYVDTSSAVHSMNLLNEEQSWTLLSNKVFADDRCPRRLRKSGREIAKNCKGLPLAIGVVAGLLKVNKAREYWESVAKDVSAAASSADDDQFFGVLSLSYNNLPAYLKPCFLYFGVFPEDYEIETNYLINLWVAEGLLKAEADDDGVKSLEEVAEEYLVELVERSLVVVTKMKARGGKIRSCSMHDMLRELSLREGEKDKFVHHVKDDDDIDKFPLLKGQRRISLRLSTNDNNLEAFRDHIDSSHVRSIIVFGYFNDNLVAFASQLRLLRVVGGLIVDSKIFPREILELVNLRYLSFMYCYNGECRIPASISKLGFLQTLRVMKGGEARHDTCRLVLPPEIWKMKQLRQLILMRSTSILLSDFGEMSLDNLQRLTRVLNFRFTKEAVERLPNLKKLRIHYRDSSYNLNWSEFHLHNLVNLHQLEELHFRYHAGYGQINQYRLPETLALPENLKKLTLERSGIPWKKMSDVIGWLPSLEVLKLLRDSCLGGMWSPVEGEFLELKHLEMSHVNLALWNAEDAHFPRLEKLDIYQCTRLKEVPLSIGDIPTLQILKIAHCNARAEESVKLIQEEQESLENDTLQVHITYTPKKIRAKAPTHTEETGRPRRFGRVGSPAVRD